MDSNLFRNVLIIFIYLIQAFTYTTQDTTLLSTDAATSMLITSMSSSRPSSDSSTSVGQSSSSSSVSTMVSSSATSLSPSVSTSSINNPTTAMTTYTSSSMDISTSYTNTNSASSTSATQSNSMPVTAATSAALLMSSSISASASAVSPSVPSTSSMTMGTISPTGATNASPTNSISGSAQAFTSVTNANTLSSNPPSATMSSLVSSMVTSPVSSMVTSPVSSVVTSPVSSVVTSPVSSVVTSPVSSVVTSPVSSVVTSPVSSVITSPVSSMITSATATQPIRTIADLTYRYTIDSASPLRIGVVTEPASLNSIEAMVKLSFSLLNFNITLRRAEITALARSRASSQNGLITDLRFASSRGDCDEQCIKNAAAIPPAGTIVRLPGASGDLVPTTVSSVPVFVSNTQVTTTLPGQEGESPPGKAAQIGMGLGITAIAILAIIEIVVLYRKFGSTAFGRQANYQLPMGPELELA